jgi:ATP-binding cassette subfamily B protein
LVAVRTHGAERAVRREHEVLLLEWSRAGFRLQGSLAGIESIQQFVGFGIAAGLLYLNMNQGETGTALLLVYWALNVPMLGQELALHLRQYPRFAIRPCASWNLSAPSKKV